MQKGVFLAAKTVGDRERYKRVEPLLNGWLLYLGLAQTWHVSLVFTDELGSGRVFATIDLDTPYRRAVIRIIRKALDGAAADDVQLYLVHEVVHILLAPLEKFAKESLGTDLNDRFQSTIEEQTDIITNVLLRMATGKEGVWK